MPGKVKTRLAAAIGATQAASVYEQLLCKTVNTAVQAGLAPVQLHVAVDLSHALFSSLADRFPVEIRAQEGNDLGQRMHHAFQNVLPGNGFAVLIGTDCPAMTSDYLRQACEALDAGTDVVLGPAEDGGYVLIGTRRSDERIFSDIPWSTSRVLDVTRNRLSSIALRCLELETLWDFDNPEDYDRWHKQKGK